MKSNFDDSNIKSFVTNNTKSILTYLITLAISTFALAVIAMNSKADEKNNASLLGQEVSINHHLRDGDEYLLSHEAILDHGKKLFEAVWTSQEGGGRPLTKGVGSPLTDPTSPLVFPRNFNRISAPDSNSCTSCHNVPRVGGGGHFVANAFIPGQRFDFITFDHFLRVDSLDNTPLRGAFDERGEAATLQTITNSRATVGMFGSGFIEMLARQMTEDLIKIRDAIPLNGSSKLTSKGVNFGVLKRNADGSWDVSLVEGLPEQALATTSAENPPSLIIRPFHQSGSVVSIREFSNNAFNHHLGLQSTERFGIDADPDGDGFKNELTRADITAVSVFQASLPVPGRVIPNDPIIERSVLLGEQRFNEINCSSCHIPKLSLERKAWIFIEPNPFNPPKNLHIGETPDFRLDLTSQTLSGLRLAVKNDKVSVPAYTDLKLHDITSGTEDPNRDPINLNAEPGSKMFFAGTQRFLTKKLWGVANEPPYFHHGKFTTMRQAILAHAGEAQKVTEAFRALSPYDQDSIIEFLKTLQVLPEKTKYSIIDENGKEKIWPPKFIHSK